MGSVGYELQGLLDMVEMQPVGTLLVVGPTAWVKLGVDQWAYTGDKKAQGLDAPVSDWVVTVLVSGDIQWAML